MALYTLKKRFKFFFGFQVLSFAALLNPARLYGTRAELKAYNDSLKGFRDSLKEYRDQLRERVAEEGT